MMNSAELDRTQEMYKKLWPICKSDGFIIEIDGKRYKKTEVTYDYVVDNASKIGYVEDTNTKDSRIYASVLVMITICLMLDRRYTTAETGIQFVGVHDSILRLISRTINWLLYSGYNSAITDSKAVLNKLRSQSDSLSRGV